MAEKGNEENEQEMGGGEGRRRGLERGYICIISTNCILIEY